MPKANTPAVAPAAEPVAAPEVAEELFVPAEATEVTDLGGLTVLSNDGPVIVDNTDVVEEVLFQPGEEIEIPAETYGLKVVEYK